MPEEFLRRDFSRRNFGRTLAAMVFIAASFLSVAVLAKYTYALPRTNSSHWICKTCKLSDSRHAQPAGATVLSTVALVVLRPEPVQHTLESCYSETSSGPSPGFFRHTSLRAPPRA